MSNLAKKLKATLTIGVLGCILGANLSDENGRKHAQYLFKRRTNESTYYHKNLGEYSSNKSNTSPEAI